MRIHVKKDSFSPRFARSPSFAEPVLYDIDNHQVESLFTSHFKIDGSSVHSNGHGYGHDRGDDMFLRDDVRDTIVSENVDFKSAKRHMFFNYKFDNVFDWSITRNESNVEFKIGEHTLTNTSIEGDWDAVSFSLFNGFYIFDRAFLNLGITQWNGSELSNPLNYSLSLGQAASFILADDNQLEIESIGGSISFDGKIGWWSKIFKKTSNYQLSATWNAYDLNDFGYAEQVPLNPGDGNIENVNTPPAALAAFIALLMLAGRVKRT